MPLLVHPSLARWLWLCPGKCRPSSPGSWDFLDFQESCLLDLQSREASPEPDSQESSFLSAPAEPVLLSNPGGGAGGAGGGGAQPPVAACGGGPAGGAAFGPGGALDDGAFQAAGGGGFPVEEDDAEGACAWKGSVEPGGGITVLGW